MSATMRGRGARAASMPARAMLAPSMLMPSLTASLLTAGLLAGCGPRPQGVARLDDPVLREREVPGAVALDAPLRQALARPRGTPERWYHVYAVERVGDGVVRYVQISTRWSGADDATRYAWYAVDCGAPLRRRVLGAGPRARDAESGRGAQPAQTFDEDGVDGRIATDLCAARFDCAAQDRDHGSRCRAEYARDALRRERETRPAEAGRAR